MTDTNGPVTCPNPFCTNRSEAGDACGECPGCVAEVAEIRAVLTAATDEEYPRA
jgi:hypothetical protein